MLLFSIMIKPTFINKNFIYTLCKDNGVAMPCPIEFVEYISSLPEDPNPFKIKSMNTQSFVLSDISLDEAMENSVKQLENLPKSPIIFWSGGLDSTGMLVAIEKFGSANLRNNVLIATTPSAALENKELFDIISKKYGQYKMLSSAIYLDNAASTNTIVHGNMADQLYGSTKINQYVSMYGTDNLGKKFSDCFNEKSIYWRYEPILKYSPTKIETVYDFFQWFAITQERELAKNRLTSLNWSNPSLAKEIVYFYNTQEFVSYALSNKHKILPCNDWARYKEHLKNYIEDYFKVDLITKTQYASGWQTMYLNDIICCSFDDGKIIKYYSELEPKYANILLSLCN
jgi:hypothetical protein